MRFGRAAALGCLVLACGEAAPPPPKAPQRTSVAATDEGAPDPFMPRFVPMLRVLPDVDEVRVAPILEDRGAVTERAIVGRMRVELRAGGLVARADEVFPTGRVFAERLPRRLGGGFLFLVITAMGSQVFRSDTWLGALVPLTTIGPAPDPDRPLVMGFDRVFVRMRTGGELYPLDPRTGEPMGHGPLPVAAGYGSMLFLDAYTGIVDTDFTGPQVSFDAGTTWTRLAIPERVRAIAPEHSDDERPRDATISTDAGAYRLSPRGELERVRVASAPPFGVLAGLRGMNDGPVDTERSGPLGKRPLRAALARGVPDSAVSAAVLQDGQLCRVSLESGALLGCEKTDVDPLAECHGIALGDPAGPLGGAGFVCGQPPSGGRAAGGTSLVALRPKGGVVEVQRFAEPRVVVESGQGNVVIHGPCSDEPAARDTRPLCVRFADDTSREIRLRGSAGGERVVALRDKTVVILVPPRPGAHGQLTILGEGAPKHLALALPEGAPREVDTGLWMEGFHQSGPDEIAGWIEGGGPIMGVRVKLDGQVTVEPAVEDADGVVVAGRFGMRLGASGTFAETVDTGKTWTDVVIPEMPRAESPGELLRCSAVGCLLPGAFKIGWGPTAKEDDLRTPPLPPSAPVTNMTLSSTPRPLECVLDAPAKEGRGAERASRDADDVPRAGMSHTSWGPLGPTPPPPLEKGFVGIDVGANYEIVPARLYVWAERDTDWARTGRMVLRFGDRFSLQEVRSSSVTTSFWGNEGDALAALGQVGGSLSWQASLDERAVLVSGCRGDRGCLLFASGEGQSIVSLRMSDDGAVPRPQGGAVRVGSSWFFLGDARGDELRLFRADLGTVRELTRLRRAGLARSSTPPKLVRRARTLGLGVSFTTRQGPNDRRGERFVLPVDPETGALGEPESLGRADLGGLALGPCGDRDGWVVETTIEGQDVMVGGRSIDTRSVELRLRLRGGHACVETGTFRPTYESFALDEAPARPGRAAPTAAVTASTPTFPLVTFAGTGKPLGLTCKGAP